MKNQEGSWIQTARIPTIVFLCVRKSGLPSDDSKMCGYGNTTVIRGRTYRRQGGGGRKCLQPGNLRVPNLCFRVHPVGPACLRLTF